MRKFQQTMVGVFLCLSLGFGEVRTASSDASAQRATINGLDENVERLSIEVQGLLQKQDFGQLETLADQLRKNKERFPGGDWKIYKFYHALARPEGKSDASEEDWQAHLSQLRAWLSARPLSITPHVALGQALVAYAWQGRGDGFADAVSDQGWRLMAQRLHQAEEVMRKGRRLPQPCPQWYCVMQDIALGQGWGQADYKKLFLEALNYEPHYLHYYSNTARYLMPRWHGDPGEWEQFADETAQRVGSKEGSMLYSHIAWQISKYYRVKEFFAQNRVSWPKVKQGFIDREDLYGASNRTLNAFARLAIAAGDKMTARELFNRIGDNWDPDAWKEKGYFDSCKASVAQ